MGYIFKPLTSTLKWIAILNASVLSGCAGMSDLSHQPGFNELAPFHVLPNIPYFPQIEDQCGPASLATVLVANGVNVKPEQLRDKLYIPGKEGTVTTEMVARVRRYGMLPYVLQPELVDVLAEINAGTPVLVMQNLGFAWLPRWHFSVAIAYNIDRQSITLRSGDKRHHEISLSLFLKTWRRANSWAMAVVPADTLPATASPQRIIKAATELEQVGEQVAALKVYQSLLKRWPNNALADFGAGNSAYALGLHEDAHNHFTAYLKARPDATEGWNNLAYNLVALGCGSQALQAMRCGLKLTPDNPVLLDSFQDINSNIKAASSGVVCPDIQCLVNL